MANKDRDAVNNGLNDLLGNVIRSDRERAGRGKPEAPQEFKAEVIDAPVQAVQAVQAQSSSPSQNEDNKTLTHYDTMTDEHSEEVSPPATARKVSVQKRKEKSVPVVKSSNASSARVDEAQEMAETSTMTVTLRIPQAFNEWLDEYVHRSWPQKVRKQELVIEALQLLYARRGRAGDDILSTSLLGEDE